RLSSVTFRFLSPFQRKRRSGGFLVDRLQRGTWKWLNQLNRLNEWLGFRFSGLFFVIGRLVDADLLQERFQRARAAEEFFNRDIYVARIADFIDFLAQSHAGVHVEITVG